MEKERKQGHSVIPGKVHYVFVFVANTRREGKQKFKLTHKLSLVDM